VARYLWSRIGTALTNVVVGLQVYDVTGWTAAVGVVGLFAVIPLVAPRDALFAVNSPARRNRPMSCRHGRLPVSRSYPGRRAADSIRAISA